MLGEEKFKGVQIYDVIQDKELNYWFATDQGLYHFDYYNYGKITCEKSKSDAVFGFTMNAEGSIYCFNLNNQVFEIKGKRCELFYELKNDEGRSDISLAIADNDHLVIGARKIIVLDKTGKLVDRYELGNGFVGPVFTNQSGGVQFHLNNSDSTLIYSKGIFTKKKLKFLSGGIPNRIVLKFYTTANNSYALDLTSKAQYRYNQNTSELTALPRNPILERSASVRIYETGNEVWFTGSFTGAALLTDESTNTDNPLYYEDYFISDAYKDREGNILLSTFNKGILVIPDLKIPDVISTFSEDPVTAIYVDPFLGLILGSSKGSLSNYTDNKTVLLKGGGRHSIDAIFGDPGSDLILFANGKIRAYNKRTSETLDIDEVSLKDAAFVSANEFYLGTNVGIKRVKWDGKKDFDIQDVDGMQFRVYSIEYNIVEKCLYASTSNGLFVIDSSGVFEKILFNGEDIFTSQLHYHEGKVYASTRKNGILIMQNNRVMQSIQPLINGKIEILGKIVIQGNFIFANSSNGFYQFDLDGNLIKSIHSVYGFSSRRTIDFAFGQNQLWVCHSGGVQQIDLAYAESTMRIPPIRFGAVFANDKAVSFSGMSEFESGQRKIQFVFSSPSLRNRETVNYHYKLAEYDTGWTINKYDENTITYNALAPGTYTMQVKAENQGAFSETISYSFSIAQPVYSRWWFIGGSVLLFLLAVYFVYKWQIQIQQRKSKQINELNASKLTAIQSQMNPHFIFNSLNSIQDLILKGDVENSYSYITTFSNLVRRTLNYSDKDFIDFEQEIKLLELYLSLEKLRFKKGLDYEMRTGNISDIMIPPLLIQPFIENALVHGLLHREGDKKLIISFELGESLVCIVEDNGVGREKSKAIKKRQRSEHESFSGKAIHTRFDILSTALKGNFGYTYEDMYQENEPAGTRVRLIIPVKRKF
jgi:Histidine kinase/Y_Y_Y domain